MAIALCVCLATILWCLLILRKRQKGPERFLAALIGLVSTYQGLHLLIVAHVVKPGSEAFNSFGDLVVTALYLIAVLVLRISLRERKNTQVHLRLVEANERITPMPSRTGGFENTEHTVPSIILESNPLATVAMDKAGRVTYWNCAAERLLGWRSHEVVGRTTPLPVGSPIRTKTGALVRVESWVSALQDPSGRTCGTLMMIAPLGAQESTHLAPVVGA